MMMIMMMVVTYDDDGDFDGGDVDDEVEDGEIRNLCWGSLLPSHDDVFDISHDDDYENENYDDDDDDS